MQGIAARFGVQIANTLFPPVCMICGSDVSDPRTLCRDCWSETALISGTVCDGCARPLDVTWPGQTMLHCDACAGREFAWSRARCAALYEGGARSLVLSLKHGDRPDLARAMAVWMARAGETALHDADCVIPVPLHWKRRLQRRLNQSAELSRGISRRAGIAHLPGLLIRARETESQRGKSFVERRRNLAGAFSLSRDARTTLAGKHVVLVDDVMTTGATLTEAALTLRKAGARNVDVLVFARA